MTTRLRYLLIAFAASFVLLACKKDKDTVSITKESLTGYWTGAYGFRSDDPKLSMSLIIRPNGTARALYGYNGADTAAATYRSEGTYKLEQNTLSFTYQEDQYIIMHKTTMTSDKSMTGTWGTAPSDSDGGKFFLNKK